MSKERLVELIRHSFFVNATKTPSSLLPEKIANDLLANGVIVLPCKVGDKVYQTDGVRIYESTIYEISITSKPIFYTRNIAFNESAIGKSIFLTRKEAEAKLRKENKKK